MKTLAAGLMQQVLTYLSTFEKTEKKGNNTGT